ncbi:MAG: hypothetical protein KF763_07185 [Cyclobacteriaceae bacterium]|nr:hypothetical protein [Cyclobacteriaceae bacterium]
MLFIVSSPLLYWDRGMGLTFSISCKWNELPNRDDHFVVGGVPANPNAVHRVKTFKFPIPYGFEKYISRFDLFDRAGLL